MSAGQAQMTELIARRFDGSDHFERMIVLLKQLRVTSREFYRQATDLQRALRAARA